MKPVESPVPLSTLHVIDAKTPFAFLSNVADLTPDGLRPCRLPWYLFCCAACLHESMKDCGKPSCFSASQCPVSAKFAALTPFPLNAHWLYVTGAPPPDMSGFCRSTTFGTLRSYSQVV